MSMMRTSGAMPMITARQMATASFAVPKSVMKTMAGFLAGTVVASFGDGAFAQPAETPRKTNSIARNGHLCSHQGIGIPLFSSTLYMHFEEEVSRFRFGTGFRR